MQAGEIMMLFCVVVDNENHGDDDGGDDINIFIMDVCVILDVFVYCLWKWAGMSWCFLETNI